MIDFKDTDTHIYRLAAWYATNKFGFYSLTYNRSTWDQTVIWEYDSPDNYIKTDIYNAVDLISISSLTSKNYQVSLGATSIGGGLVKIKDHYYMGSVILVAENGESTCAVAANSPIQLTLTTNINHNISSYTTQLWIANIAEVVQNYAEGLTDMYCSSPTAWNFTGVNKLWVKLSGIFYIN